MVSGQLACSFIFEEMEGRQPACGTPWAPEGMDSAFEGVEAKRLVLRGPQGICFSSTHCPYKTFPGSPHCCLDGLFSAV